MPTWDDERSPLLLPALRGDVNQSGVAVNYTEEESARIESRVSADEGNSTLPNTNTGGCNTGEHTENGGADDGGQASDTEPIQHGSEKIISDTFESMDYDEIENALFLEEERTRGYNFVVYKSLARWVVMLLVGVVTALIAVVIDIGITNITSVKFKQVKDTLDDCIANESIPSEGMYNSSSGGSTGACLLKPYVLWISWNIALVFVAALLVTRVSECAKGSGIPQIKCYLNGIKIPAVVKIRTLVAKVVGVMCSAACCPCRWWA